MSMLNRRSLLLGLAAMGAAGGSRLAVAAAPGENRLVVVVLRGALDGLATVQPYADPALRTLRGPLALPEPGQEGGVLDLGGRFGLHPAMPGLHGLYGANQALLVHAVAGPYRGRSHFDGQDFLESGAERRLADGWLNRAVAALWPAETRAAGSQGRKSLALGATVPLLLKGAARPATYAPRALPPASDHAMELLAGLYARDPLLGPPLSDGRISRARSAEVLGHGPMGQQGGDRGAFVALSEAAGRLLAQANGPRVAALELGGFDTHAMQSTRLAPVLGTLDAGLAALKTGLGEAAWARTVVVAISEFGRTVRINGTSGTDHGTGGLAILAGGRVAGGRVSGTWPGLSDLHENRDLMPTTDARAISAAVLVGHMGLPRAALANVFPESAGLAPMPGLLRG
jgi:uncharacterized protein (DUF1501 family)